MQVEDELGGLKVEIARIVSAVESATLHAVDEIMLATGIGGEHSSVEP